MVTSTTAGHEVSMPVLTASSKKLSFLCHLSCGGVVGGKRLVSYNVAFLVALQLWPLQNCTGLG